MNVTILAIGKKHEPRLEAAILEYSKRLSHYVKLQWQLVDTKTTATMSENEIRDAESRLIINRLNTGDTVILLDERGQHLDSPQLADKLQNYMNQGTKNLVFVIGGAYGVSEEMINRVNSVWSLSKLVFPHQLVRLILAEQLYRAHTILAGEKYHHI